MKRFKEWTKQPPGLGQSGILELIGMPRTRSSRLPADRGVVLPLQASEWQSLKESELGKLRECATFQLGHPPLLAFSYARGRRSTLKRS